MENTARPFYGEYAWAYDLLLARPASRVCDGLIELLAKRGVRPTSKILDAGCGTGSYALEFARRGYSVTGIDLSTPLLTEAQKQTNNNSLAVSLVRGTILALPFRARFDAILCRGVLNDLLDDESREKVFVSFAGALRPTGVLLFDVREWGETVKRKMLEPVFETSVETLNGRLAFRSQTRLDHTRHQLLVSERHVLDSDGGETASVYDFVMRCWTQEELQRNLTRAGFDTVEYFGDYDARLPVGASDRVVCMASLK